jgi:hypothetical protein
MSEPDRASISLDEDRALVLFELAIRLQSSADLLPGEIQVLDHLVSDLERQLSKPFLPDYGNLVAQARTRLTCGAD